MKAVAVFPGVKGSAHLEEIPKPGLDEIPGGRGVLVKVLSVGLCGTDIEICEGQYGTAPENSKFLVIGHENFGVVEAVGSAVRGLMPGDYVVTTVRRPGKSVYDLIGTSDMSTDDSTTERGISSMHGYMTEYYVDDADFVVKVPRGLREVGVLLEPCSVIEKGIAQAYEIQRRLKVWRPRKVAVLGAGPIGILAALALKRRGLEVFSFGLVKPPYRNSDLLAQIGVQYLSTASTSLLEASAKDGPFDLIFEATGYSPIIFEAMNVLGKDGVLVLASVTGGGRSLDVPADKINMGFVLGNKVMVGTVNANRSYFEEGVQDLCHAEMEWPGWLGKLLTHKVAGLENFKQLFELHASAKDAIKVSCQVAALPGAP